MCKLISNTLLQKKVCNIFKTKFQSELSRGNYLSTFINNIEHHIRQDKNVQNYMSDLKYSATKKCDIFNCEMFCWWKKTFKFFDQPTSTRIRGHQVIFQEIICFEKNHLKTRSPTASTCTWPTLNQETCKLSLIYMFVCFHNLSSKYMVLFLQVVLDIHGTQNTFQTSYPQYRA